MDLYVMGHFGLYFKEIHTHTHTHGQSGGPPLWVSPLGVYLGDSGFVPLRGLDLEHFVHGLLSMGLGL